MSQEDPVDNKPSISDKQGEQVIYSIPMTALWCQ